MTVPISVGDVIDGNYVVEKLLGEGGMGAVFVAREERLGRRVAIKVLLDAVAKNPEAVTRFEREARSAAALHSDYVTRVLSVGHLTGGSPYIVMEYLEGEDLATVLATRGPLPFAEVVGFMVHACEALAEAHSAGIVHRDLKPANLFLARRPGGGTRIKVLDFGISKTTLGGSSQALTKTTALMGTPMYMSPEQLREVRNVDGRADVWALGIMMYELLSGTPPFMSDALAELCVLIMTTAHPPLSSRRPDVPPALEAIVERCVQKDPGARFATAQELMAALATVSLAPPVRNSDQPDAVQPMPPRMSTPRMSPRLLTSDIEGRERAGAPTQAAGVSQGNVTAPHANAPSRPLTYAAATVDPVSNTPQPWMPAKGPGAGLIAMIFVAAAGLGGLLLYFLVVRPSTGAAAAAGESGASGLVAAPPSAASALPVTTASSSPSATSTSTPAASAPTPTPVAPPSPPPPVVVQKPAAALPPPNVPATPAVGRPATPAAVKPTTPPSSPGSLMPGARN